MKVRVEFEIPELEWVNVPTNYCTPIGEFADIQHVNAIQDLIEYLQRLDEIEWIINANHQHVRHPFCRELVRDRLRFVPENQIWWMGEQLSHFLMGFRKYSGLKFSEYKFKYLILSNGKKVQIKGFTQLFNTEEEAIRHRVHVCTSGKNFDFEILEGKS